MYSSAHLSDKKAITEIFTAAKVHQAAPKLAEWYTSGQLNENFVQTLESEILRVFSDDLAELFQQHAPVVGVTTSNAYKNRVIEVPGLGFSLAGIRFRSLDLNKPFVSVVAHKNPILVSDALRDATTFIAEQFQEFSPKHVQYFVPNQLNLSLNDFEGHAQWSQHVLAAPIDYLKALPLPSGYERVNLERPDNLSFYQAYSDEYRRLHEENPSHLEFAHVESEEALNKYLQKGVLREVKIDGDWSGVVAASPSTKEGIRGFSVTEMLLVASKRNKGFGAVIGRHLIEHLPAEIGDGLYGSIHDGNLAARRSAERTGRSDIGAYLLLETQFMAIDSL